jgi:hypothetical protein
MEQANKNLLNDWQVHFEPRNRAGNSQWGGSGKSLALSCQEVSLIR